MARRKTVTFDLSVERLQDLYVAKTGKHYLSAYSDLRRVLNKYGFSHSNQDSSVYTSDIAITTAKAESLIKSVFQDLPWLFDCVNAMHMHDYVNEIDILKLAEENGFHHDNLTNIDDEYPPERTDRGSRDEI